MRPVQFIVLLLALGLSAVPAAGQTDELVALCEDCHGIDGVSVHSDVPTIAGQSASFLSKSLKTFQIWGRPCIKSSFRHGDTSRPKTDMCQIAEGLTGEEIKALGEHFSARTFVPTAQPFEAELVARGAGLHQEHCETCHEQGGTVSGRGPRLAGQWVPYLKIALKFVPTGEHLVPPAMESVIAGLSEQDIDALMNYFASQQN